MIIESEFSDNAEGEEIFKKHLTLKFRYDIISTLTIWQRIKYAGVAELADALASGASGLRLVKVQVLSPAPVDQTRSVMVFMADLFSLLIAAAISSFQGSRCV